MPAPSNAAYHLRSQPEPVPEIQQEQQEAEPILVPPPVRIVHSMPTGIKLQHYHGKDDAKTWWQLFMGWATLNPMIEGDILLAVPLHLSPGAPLVWFNGLSTAIQNNLAQLKEAFLARFTVKRDPFDADLFAIKQQEDESVDNFFVRLETRALNSDIPETVLVSLSIQALKGRIAEKVYLSYPKPTTLNEVRAAAMSAEHGLRFTQRENSNSKLLQLEQQLTQMTAQLETTLAALQPPSHEESYPHPHPQAHQRHQARRTDQTQQFRPTYQQNRSPARQEEELCSNCGTFCNRNKCPASQSNCFKCNRLGHFGRVCRSSRFNQNNQSRYTNTSYYRK